MQLGDDKFFSHFYGKNIASYLYARLWRQQNKCLDNYDTFDYFMKSALLCNSCINNISI